MVLVQGLPLFFLLPSSHFLHHLLPLALPTPIMHTQQLRLLDPWMPCGNDGVGSRPLPDTPPMVHHQHHHQQQQQLHSASSLSPSLTPSPPGRRGSSSEEPSPSSALPPPPPPPSSSTAISSPGMVEGTLADTKLLLSEQISERDLISVARPFKKAIRERRRRKGSPQEEMTPVEQSRRIVDEAMVRRVADIVDQVAASVSSPPSERSMASVIKKKSQSPAQLQQPQLRLEEILCSGPALASATVAIHEPLSCVCPPEPPILAPEEMVSTGSRSRVELCRRRSPTVRKVVPSPAMTAPVMSTDEDDKLQLPSPHMLNSMMIMTIDGGRNGRGEND